MTDKKDEYYQPWLRDPSPAPEPLPRADEGLAKPKDAPPVGIDVGRYTPKPAPARDPRVTGEQLKAGAARLWSAIRHGAAAFADWTIDVGERADIPARVEAMEIPRRTRDLAQRSGRGAARAARAVGRGSAKAARSAASASGEAWDKMALGDKVAKISSEAGRGIGEVAGKTKAGIGQVAEELAPPPSGLEQLLAREEAEARAADAQNAGDLPLFAGEAIPATLAETQAKAAAIAAVPDDDRTPHVAAPAKPKPARAKAMTAGRLPQRQGGMMDGVSTRTLLIGGIAALALLGATFWLGGRFGGGMSKSEVETIVGDYIRANPEIIPEALEAQRDREMAKAIDAIRPALEKPYAGAWAGNADGDVTLVVFTDYACGFCRASVPDVDRLVREDKRLKEALFQRELDANLAIATQLQLNATPTWVVGDQLFQGQVGYDALKRAIAKARSKS